MGVLPHRPVPTSARRDEGTSYHYLPAAAGARLSPALATALAGLVVDGTPVHHGRSWTTDAPYRQTAQDIRAAADDAAVAVEMEAASLYTLSSATGYHVVCFALISNQMASIEGDFEKGHEQARAPPSPS